MRLTDEEFGRLSLLQFGLLSDRLEVRREHDYICAGIVAATIANVNRDPQKRPEGFSPLDFVPGYKAPEPKDMRSMTPEEQQAHFMNVFLPAERQATRQKI
jgi:hypothetical protein